MRAQKNQTVQYLDTLDMGRRKDILKRAVKLGKMQRKKRREKQADLMLELSRRQEEKLQARVTSEKTKMETKLKRMKISELGNNFPDLSQEQLGKVAEFLSYLVC